MTEDAEAALTEVFKDEWPRLIGAAARIVGDLQTAEDVVQETLLTALDKWPLRGVPDRPGAWLMTVCRNRARNAVRDSGRERHNSAALIPLLAGSHAEPGLPGIADDRLRLIVMCCHPGLSVDAQVALTLRMVGGLTTEEISAGFHVPVSAVAQRIVRAKRALKAQRAEFACSEADIGARLPAVLDVIYLIFNEGYLAASGETLTRGDLAAEAHRLIRMVTELVPGEADTWALRALLSFQLSRWATRTDSDGALLTLDAQDRGEWNRDLIDDGVSALARARSGERGPLLLQAELAACHATAPSFEQTRWDVIVGIYDELLELSGTPVVELNRAVAVAMLDGPAAALPLLDRLAGDPALRGSHRVWAVRADLHRRLADDPALCGSHRVWAVRADLHRRLADAKAALADYDRALDLVTNETERRYLIAARRRLTDPTPRGRKNAAR